MGEAKKKTEKFFIVYIMKTVRFVYIKQGNTTIMKKALKCKPSVEFGGWYILEYLD